MSSTPSATTRPVKKILAIVVLALVCVPVSLGAGTTNSAQLPTRGILTPGESLAGVHLGDTVAKVKRLWGSNYKLSPSCKAPTWLYFYSRGEPLGAGVRFDKQGRVVATANGKKLYFDLIVLGTGRTITAVTISSFLQPVPARYEQALARLVVTKLGGPVA